MHKIGPRVALPAITFFSIQSVSQSKGTCQSYGGGPPLPWPCLSRWSRMQCQQGFASTQSSCICYCVACAYTVVLFINETASPGLAKSLKYSERGVAMGRRPWCNMHTYNWTHVRPAQSRLDTRRNFTLPGRCICTPLFNKEDSWTEKRTWVFPDYMSPIFNGVGLGSVWNMPDILYFAICCCVILVCLSFKKIINMVC